MTKQLKNKVVLRTLFVTTCIIVFNTIFQLTYNTPDIKSMSQSNIEILGALDTMLVVLAVGMVICTAGVAYLLKNSE